MTHTLPAVLIVAMAAVGPLVGSAGGYGAQPATKPATGPATRPAARPAAKPSAPATAAVPLSEVVARPVSIRTGIGAAHEPVTTRVAEAQRLHDQGLAYLHSFAWIDAARSFNQALRADSGLALAYVGLSYALGELGLSAAARTASEQATARAAPVTARERARIELRASQLAAADRPGDAAAATAYRTLLDRVVRDFPSDVELLLLAGHAQGSTPHGHGMTASGRALEFYERARTLAPDYFAVHHYLAHALENAGRPLDALPHAKRFAAAAPNVPHAHHMYGHSLRLADRFTEAIAEFRTADTQHVAAAAADTIPVTLDWHYRHNLDLLGTSYQYVGQMTRAATVLRQSFEMRAVGYLGQEQDVHKRAWPLFLMARGRFDEARTAAASLQAHPSVLVQALGHILASRVYAVTGRLELAATEGNTALQQMRSQGSAGGTLVPDFELAQGEHLLRAGDVAKGGAMVLAGLGKLRADRSPDAWAATVFQLEAAVHTARTLNQPALAANVAALLQAHAPAYAGTHYALGLLAEARGDRPGAHAAYAAALERWRDADTDLPQRRDAQSRLAAIGGPATAKPSTRPRPKT